MVYSNRLATADEVADLQKHSGAKLSPGRVFVLEVDSSFGSGGNPAYGGVERRTWNYDSDTARWYSAGSLAFRASPYGTDTLHGIYRAPEAR